MLKFVAIKNRIINMVVGNVKTVKMAQPMTHVDLIIVRRFFARMQRGYAACRPPLENDRFRCVANDVACTAP